MFFIFGYSLFCALNSSGSVSVLNGKTDMSPLVYSDIDMSTESTYQYLVFIATHYFIVKFISNFHFLLGG